MYFTSDNSSWNTKKRFLYKDIQELIRSIFIYSLKTMYQFKLYLHSLKQHYNLNIVNINWKMKI